MSEAPAKAIKILAVDDEEIVQSLIRDAMEEEGHEVFTASNGREALRVLNSTRIDLLITDIRMPIMDGTQLVEKAREAHPGVGVVFMTGYASLTSAQDAIKQGALDYIMKPFELTEIRQAVRNAIGKLAETAAAASHRQLSSLSDLSNMLFAAGDRTSLVTSSLRFAMMHLRSSPGSIVYYGHSREEYVMLTIDGENVEERPLGTEPLYSLGRDGRLLLFQEPSLVGCLDDHPVYQEFNDENLESFLIPNWLTEGNQMVVVPIMRAAAFHGFMMLAHDDDTIRVKKGDLKFLSITANQLAITLENLGLLEESQQAYSRLKQLQDQTIELEKMATRGALSAEIGHELNNFLGVVAGNVDLLQAHLKRGNYDKLEKYLNTVSDTLAKITRFTHNLMDLRSISSEKEPLQFDAMLSEVVEYLRPQKRFQGVEITMPQKFDPIPFLGDPTQIQQLLYNLFHNAADATVDCERREITVHLESSPDQGIFRVSIEDTGVGFDTQLLEKAFQEKFTTKKSGHGFGLVVCKRIIDNHGGELSVESSPGEGTCISINFPLAAEELEPVPVG